MKKRWLLPIGLLALILTPFVLVLVMPGRWLVMPLEITATALSGRAVSIGGLELELLSRKPAATVIDVSVKDDAGDPLVSVGNANIVIDAGKLLEGDVRFDRVDIDKGILQLRTDADGANNWQDLIPVHDESEASIRGAPASLPAIAVLNLKDFEIDYQNARAGVSLNLLINASASTLADDIDTSVNAVGEFNGQTVELRLQTNPLQALTSNEQAVRVDAQFSLDDTLMTAIGEIGDLSDFRDLDLMVSLEAPALEDLAKLIDVPLPVIPPYRIAGSLRRAGDDTILDQFDGEIGDSDMHGDLRLDMTTTPLTLYANVISRKLDLDDLAGIVGAQSDDEETQIVDDRVPTFAAPGKLLPNKSLNLKAVANSFNGAINYQALSVQSPVWPVDSLDIRIEVQSDRLVLSPVTVGLAGGRVEGSLDFELDQAAINIKGTFTEPTVRPGKALATRAAVAAALVSVASPVAALLPFVQSGTGQDSPFCDGLIEAIDDED